MKSTKTKMVIIITSIIAVAIVVLLISIIVLSKNKTQTKQEDLWIYVFSGNVKSILENYTNIENYNSALSDKKYQTTTTLSCKVNTGDEELDKKLGNLEIIKSAKVDNTTNQAIGSVAFNYLKNEMFKIDYIKDKDSFGIKSDEVMDMYLGIKNNNLNAITKQFGISDFPDKIELEQYKQPVINVRKYAKNNR